ncbi:MULTISPECIES: DNA-3-methyladenine glycosylase [unclassified Microbacterium]|uniref:DNA-3-methyladenine glycosylase family protein n=1 Tax=unclassified Microbacterium TaxID=2609290 RepID=UPI001604A231|nr:MULTISPECIES: DNA-3-methyladenine glycosylase 2 family protein [unclassified Microbacterium]QNA91896.1 DNA-3-methyladenine glycosylase 2 family protein [Microbacterium sp. Se63.02b]QYM65117.1 DNA-3-methyladenine glycosylase 2 family protein [Microbacterium sp. Se5.02b]
MTLTADSAAADAVDADLRRDTVYRPPHDLDLLRTVGMLRRGRNDPTMIIDGPIIWRALRTPLGPVSLALRLVGGEVRATAWGPGAEHALARVPALCGADDDDDGFDASRHPLIAEAGRRNPGLRLTRTDEVFDALACAIIEQKVTGMQAFGAWRWLVSRYGERAPGPTPRPLFAPPSAEHWRCIPSWAWHRAGVEPPQSRTIVRAAERGDRIASAVQAATSGADRDRVLTSLPGVGVWTSAETRIRALGDPDAVSVGDYHLAHEVGFALAGKRTDDAGMLELLAPWAGHRQRVVRLIFASGVHEPRRGPRLAPEDHRDR